MRYQIIIYTIILFFSVENLYSSDLYMFLNSFDKSLTEEDAEKRFFKLNSNKDGNAIVVKDVILGDFPKKNNLILSFKYSRLSKLRFLTLPPTRCLNAEEKDQRICKDYRKSVLRCKEKIIRKFIKKFGNYKIIESDYLKDQIYFWQSKNAQYYIIIENLEEGTIDLKVLINFEVSKDLDLSSYPFTPDRAAVR